MNHLIVVVPDAGKLQKQVTQTAVKLDGRVVNADNSELFSKDPRNDKSGFRVRSLRLVEQLQKAVLLFCGQFEVVTVRFPVSHFRPSAWGLFHQYTFLAHRAICWH